MTITPLDMADSLSTDEEQAVKEFVTEVNRIRLTQGIGPLSWSTAVKFMMARKFDHLRALQLYETHEIIRRREGLLKFDPDCEPLKSELETGKFTILPTRDVGGAAIALFHAGKHDPFVTSHNATLQGLLYQMDVALESFQTQRNGVVFIYDMNESKYANFDYELSTKMLTLLKGGYPARLKKVLIVTAPLWFKAPFKILRLFVREKLRDRVYMVSGDQLSLHVPLSSLPVELGGALSFDHGQWLSHCRKCMANRGGDLCDLMSVPNSPTGMPFALQLGSSGGETTDSEQLSSVDEKHNTEDREKEVEVIKDPNDEKSKGDENNPGLTLEEFICHLKRTGKRGLLDEYAQVKAQGCQGTFQVARLKQNQAKNRYSDVLSYDHTRVKLINTALDPTSDYVNANFVDGYCQKNAFISTQGPLPKTGGDFWLMIWEQEVGVIVMTTRTMERGRVKCDQYWPYQEGQIEEYQPFFELCNAKVDNNGDYILTTVTITNTQSGETRKVHHLQFVGWPDYGVPQSALAMLTFREKVRELQASIPNPKAPIVVHCSAGIGRTGTFITLDICINRLLAEGRVDVRGVVEKVRSQRAHSIQMPDQYVFCHLALLQFAFERGILQDLQLDGFSDADSDSE